jgi:hypothetical protein
MICKITLACLATLLCAGPVLAQKGPSASSPDDTGPQAHPVFGVLLGEFDENGANQLNLDGLSASILSQTNEGGTTTPVFVVSDAAGELIRFEGEENFMSFLPVTLRMAQLDRASPEPEIIATAYTGGAHCCEQVQVAAIRPDGTWHVEVLGYFDGGYQLSDPHADGTAVIQVADQSFLYTFDCYACSYAPPRFHAVRDGMVVDVSAEPSMQSAFAAEQRRMNLTQEREQEPGFLAGWAAVRARLGEGEQALAEIAGFGGGGDYVYDSCTTGGSPFECAPENLREMGFLDFLRDHLIEEGYLMDDQPPGAKTDSKTGGEQ